MRILEGALELSFHGDIKRCPMAGVREPDGTVEVAVATPFGLRRIHVHLDAERRIVEAHTFAFDYESGEVTRFELDISGGPQTPDRRVFAGTVREAACRVGGRSPSSVRWMTRPRRPTTRSMCRRASQPSRPPRPGVMTTELARGRLSWRVGD